jgi:hypothetical protein
MNGIDVMQEGLKSQLGGGGNAEGGQETAVEE